MGDAAVPDDTSLVHPRRHAEHRRPSAINIREAARVLGVHVKGTLRPLVVPPPNGRPAGFTRPRYLAYAEDKRALQLIACPHDDCDGVCDVVVLLPGLPLPATACSAQPADARQTSTKWPTVVFHRHTRPAGSRMLVVEAHYAKAAGTSGGPSGTIVGGVKAA